MLEPLSWRFSGELSIDPTSLRIDLPGEENNSLGYWVQPRTTFAVEGNVVWYRTGTPPTQSLDIELTLGENNLEASVVNGTFSGIMLAPLLDGTYGLYGDLQNAPNGAIYRGDGSAFVWFIVDNQALVWPPLTNRASTPCSMKRCGRTSSSSCVWTKTLDWTSPAFVFTGLSTKPVLASIPMCLTTAAYRLKFSANAKTAIQFPFAAPLMWTFHDPRLPNEGR